MATTLIWYGGPWAPCRIYRKASGSVRPYSLIGRPSTRSPDLHGSTRAARSARRVRGRSSIGRIKPDQGLALGHRHPADGGLGQVPDCGGLGELGEAQEGQAAGLRQQRADLSTVGGSVARLDHRWPAPRPWCCHRRTNRQTLPKTATIGTRNRDAANTAGPCAASILVVRRRVVCWPGWRNRHTRTPQKRLSLWTCGFESRSRHPEDGRGLDVRGPRNTATMHPREPGDVAQAGRRGYDS